MCSLHPLRAEWSHPGIDLPGLWTGNSEFFGRGTLVDDLDESRRESRLLQNCFGRTALHFDPRFRIDGDNKPHLWIDQVLELVRIAPLCCGRDCFDRVR